MNIIHTGDWHLGKKLFKESRLVEQHLFVQWLAEIIIEQKIDLLIIAGDIFDTPSPPAEATKLFFDFLQQISSKTLCHIVAIAGNHDSGPFIEAPKNILQDKRITLCGKIPDTGLVTVDFPMLRLTLLPFFRSYDLLRLKKYFQEQTENSNDQPEQQEENQILSTLHHLFAKAQTPNRHNMLVAHHLFGAAEKFEMGGSEQAINLSGLASIPQDTLVEYFDYVALGHIHKRCIIKKEQPAIHYPGAPLPFRFSEVAKKVILKLEVNDQAIIHSEIVVPVFRPLLSLETDFQALPVKLDQLVSDYSSCQLNAYLEVHVRVLTPTTGIADIIRQRLQQAPIELLSLKVSTDGEERPISHDVMSELPSLVELFQLFYESKYPESPAIPETLNNTFMELLSSIGHSNDGDPR